MEKVSIVIPVYGQWHLAKRNIDALLKYDRKYIAEIIVVDDCSPEKNPYEFDQEVTVITNKQNKGYAGTVNNGLKRTKSDIIVLLDSDAYPVGPFLRNVLAMYAADSTLGCIGFRTVDDDGLETGSHTYEPSLLGLLAGQQMESRLGLYGKKNILPYSCSVSFRRECLAEVGYLNEQVFPVLDADLDHSMRIHRSNWKLLFAPEITISHMGGHSYKVNSKRVLLFHESRWRLLREYNLIASPTLARFGIKSRVKLELLIFQFLRFFAKPENHGYEEKIEGRKKLLQVVGSYV
jgi:GT2 family glycosyltransferase